MGILKITKHEVTKFDSFKDASKCADLDRNNLAVVHGDDLDYWVVMFSDFARLLNAGFYAAE